jgi:ribonuclease P protein component
VERRFRLTRSTDIKRVRRLGKSYAHPLIVLQLAVSDKQETRFGIIAGRSVGGAVQRNHAKRLMRESLRSLLPEINPGWDILLLARRGMDTATFTKVQNTMTTLLQRAHLLMTHNHVHQS